MLKKHQIEAIYSLMKGKDCICSLPTGYGKSLIYELLPFLFEDAFVVVIAPLNVIIEQQVQKLRSKAIAIGNELSENELSLLKSGNYKYLFSHPEQILGKRNVSSVFCSDLFRQKRVFIVIDEAHCVLDWGESFRSDFRKLYQLRSLFPSCTMLALSATVTQKGQQEIGRWLRMPSHESVCASPARNNIVLHVYKRPSPTSKGNSVETPYKFIFLPVLEQLKIKQDSFPITIIYCKTMQWIGFGYELAKQVLKREFYAGEEKPENARVVMFHSAMERSSGMLKQMIVDMLRKPVDATPLRLVISSVALGMGVDLQHVQRVIHAGPPTNLETYVQEIGRAGRTGNTAHAALYYNPGDVCVQGMAKEMKEYCNNNTMCRRQLINKYFGFETKSNEAEINKCCNVCDKLVEKEWDFIK